MTPSVYTYENPAKQQVCFRGYVKVYEGATVKNISCAQVHTNKAQAINDAKKLMRTL